ncbi:hypothetical protein ThrDRAFT_01526 [Frankia casuarinae]|jgi:hypothetical protein|nr:hypothetical protein ThrDRAFT_01526 [Frankia casuarinae]KDA42067.1 hypothetical protein BMG523Draft_03078 [Frankia sp. BMG5.23]
MTLARDGGMAQITPYSILTSYPIPSDPII